MRRFERQIGVGGLVLTEREKRLVNEVLDSGRLTYGPMTRRFERQFADAHGCRHALFMNSGTSALHLALQALKARLGWAEGDEVIVPAVTFVATANVVLHNGLKPVFADVEPDTFNLDPAAFEAAITPRTRAVIPVHLLGLPATMGPILDVARRHGLRVVEDSCEAMFARYRDRVVGSMGDIGAFSTYVAHFLVTGVGGIATTSDADLADDMRSLMNHGRDTVYVSASDDEGAEGDTLDDIVARRFSFLRVGHSARCTEMEAALGLGQLERADALLARRRQIAAWFNQELAMLSGDLQLPSCPADRTHSFMLYGLVVKNEGSERLVRHLERLNIETRPLLPLVNQPVYRRLFGEDLEARFPVARRLNHSGFYIGCHPYMRDEEVAFVVDAFRDFFRR